MQMPLWGRFIVIIRVKGKKGNPHFGNVENAHKSSGSFMSINQFANL